MTPQKPKIIDTHTHLYDPVFRNDRTNVLVESRKIGISAIITVSETLHDARINLKLAKVHDEILPAVGLYPGIIDPKQAEEIEAFICRYVDQIVSIGEVGLDRWVIKDEEQRRIQAEIFGRFIELSLELDLPLNVHSRSAGKYAIDLLLEKDASQVQLHAFDGKTSYAKKAVEAGYYFSIPPSITRSNQKQKLVKQLPLSSLLLETDSPVLGPDPDKRNTPPNIRFAAEAIAEIKDISLDEVYQTTYENTLKLYGNTKPFQQMSRREKDFDHSSQG